MNKIKFICLLLCSFCFAQPDVRIVKKGTTEILQFKSKTSIKTIILKKLDFYDEDTVDKNFIVDCFSFQKNKNRVVLAFNYPSNDDNHSGYCGNGIEAGFIVLNLDSKYNITSKKRILTESCFNNIENKIVKETEFIEIFKVTDNNGTTIVTLDKKLAEITVKNE
jgi:hypothetical protein